MRCSFHVCYSRPVCAPLGAGGFFVVDDTPTILHSHAQMNVDQSLREIERRNPEPPRSRAGHGQWTDPARVVIGLTEKGWSVSDAVREVISTHKLFPPDRAFKGIRAAYYVILKQPKKDPVEDFEV